jgi:hypothetical protein
VVYYKRRRGVMITRSAILIVLIVGFCDLLGVDYTLWTIVKGALFLLAWDIVIEILKNGSSKK